MRRIALGFLAVALSALPAGPASATDAKKLRPLLARELSASGPASGAHMVDVGRKRVLFSVRANKPRVMMSNTKLFTTAAALEAFGGKGTTVESLVGALKTAGLARVRGGVVGDGSLFDSELGPPRWQLNDTPPGPVGALQFNRGIVGDSVFGTQFAIDPAAFAAERLQRALVAAGVAVEGTARAGPTPSGAVDLAAVQSPPLSTLVRLVNKPSDNLLAETLAKRLGLRAGGRGTRAAGVAAALRFGGRLGVRGPRSTPAPALFRSLRRRRGNSSGCWCACGGCARFGCYADRCRSPVATARSATACALPRPSIAAARRPVRTSRIPRPTGQRALRVLPYR
jgi:serine-type D-Ala-D-Ala carboxypeptidase/endopeptidase (penicillin-binding protein 4)